MRGRVLYTGDDDPANAKQTARRTEALSGAVQQALQAPARALENLNRVGDVVHENHMKVSFKEFMDIRLDPMFESWAKYGQALIFYCDQNGHVDTDRPRTDKDGNLKPIRPILVNEMGILHKKDGTFKIITLRDAGPDDKGEGKYHQVQEKIS